MPTLSAPHAKAKLLGLMSAGLASATLGLAASPAQALTQFAGDYAPGNWTQSIGGDGSIDTSGAPASIVLKWRQQRYHSSFKSEYRFHDRSTHCGNRELQLELCNCR